MFAEVPFLNGGLFECLDKTKTIDGVEQAYNYDGFSRNDRTFADGCYCYRAIVPNTLFFDEKRGLFSILNKYNFTIEENTPRTAQVARHRNYWVKYLKICSVHTILRQR